MKRLFLSAVAGLMLVAVPALAQESSADVKVARALYGAGNVQGAVARLEPAAAKGDAEAAYLMGEVYRNGSDAYAKDMAKAAEWYRKAGELGNLTAMFLLGGQLQDGRGVAKDEAEAFQWFERAAKGGHTRAAYFAGDALMNGTGVTKDVARGIPFLKQAADDGYRLAMVDYGFALDKGNGVAADQAAAFKWYRKGGELGSGTGAFNTGVFYRDGLGGVAQNRAAAMYWFLRAAMADTPHGNADAEIAALREGGWSRNAETDALYDKAMYVSTHSNSTAEFHANKPKSAALFLEAAQLGDVRAVNFMMTATREKGWGVEEQDLAKSRQWAQISAEMDDKEGQRVLAAYMLAGAGGPRNTQGARFWYEKSAMNGNPQSMMALAKIYDGNDGLPPNEALAIYWYKQAYAKNWFGAEQVLLARGVLKPDPVSTAFIQRIDSQGPDRSSLDRFTIEVAQYCKYGGTRCTALSIEARKMEKAQNAAADSANMARLWNVYSNPSESDAKWRERSECMAKKTESIQRHTYGQQDWYYSGSCY